jgi:hypothetical protein
MKKALLIVGLAVVLTLALGGAAFAATSYTGAELSKMCSDDPSLMGRLSSSDLAKLHDYVTPVSGGFGAIDTRTGKVLMEVTTTGSGPIAPMGTTYYNVPCGSSPFAIQFYVYYNNLIGQRLFTFYENHQWSFSGGHVTAEYYNAFTSTGLPAGVAYHGLVSASNTGGIGSYYFQRYIQGWYSIEVPGFPAVNKYPVIDFTDWAGAPAHITWHGTI